MKEGLIVTEDDREQETTGGSRALLPTKTTLYKVIKVLSGGSAARVKNLCTGNESTRSINKLGRLKIHNVYDLNLDPLMAFQKDETLRTSNIYKQLQGKFDFLESEKEPIAPDPGRLRSGRVYSAQVSNPVKSCLQKKKLIKLCEGDLDYMRTSQRKATIRGLQLALELGYKQSKLEKTLINKTFQHNTLHHYNINNAAKPRTGTKVHFPDNLIHTNSSIDISPHNVSDFEMVLMGIYYSVSLTELRHHVVIK